MTNYSSFCSLPITSAIPSIIWPAVPSPAAAQMMTQLFYFSVSEKMSPQDLQENQFAQLLELINFSRKNVAYYREELSTLPHFGSIEDLKLSWLDIPLLSRQALQIAKEKLFSEPPIASHEPSEMMTSTGSTGMPVTVKGNVATQFFWNAITLRDHLWHQNEFDKTFAVIRYTENPAAAPPHGAVFENWGAATYRIVPTGKNYHLTICTTEQEAAWLREINPHYLNCNPSTLRELTLYFKKYGNKPSNLCMVHTNSEIVEPDLRELVREVLGAKLIDTYSARELGYIALQCPEADHYHVQSENVLVEILNDQNQPCEIGEPGRVVVTALHNFASPLIRYVVGDYAIAGELCSCGRTLPVIKRVLGRQRNVLKLPDGKKIWPSFASNGLKLMDLFPKGQFQVIQKSYTEIHINLARMAVFSKEEESKIKSQLQTIFGYPFNFVLNYLDNIARGPGGKFEDFKCEIV